MAGRQAAQATQQLQKGVSPGVRASGPFAKTIAQQNAAAQKTKNMMRAAGNVAGKALGGGMGSKFGK